MVSLMPTAVPTLLTDGVLLRYGCLFRNRNSIYHFVLHLCLCLLEITVTVREVRTAIGVELQIS